MSIWGLAFRSIRQFWRLEVSLALGVAAATAVLTGALIVGDSMRSSLRTLALDRLGMVDHIIVSDGFFRAELADSLKADATFDYAEPVIWFPNATVEWRHEQGSNESAGQIRVSNVNVFGVRKSFFELAADAAIRESPSGTALSVNRELAERLRLGEDDLNKPRLTLRFPKPRQLPADTSLAKNDNLVESLVDLQIGFVVPNRGLGGFSMHVSQMDPLNVFVPIELLDEALRQTVLSHRTGLQANSIFLASTKPKKDQVDRTSEILGKLRPNLDDLGLAIKHVRQMRADSDETVFDYFSLYSDRLLLPDEMVTAVLREFPDAIQVFTYLANDIRKDGFECGVPFSTVTAIDFGPHFQLMDIHGKLIEPLRDFQIVLNRWAAEDLGIREGAQLKMTYFEPEAAHGSAVEREAHFEVKAIAQLAQPDTPFRLRGGNMVRAQFQEQSPTLANDPDLTPEVPGLTDAASIDNWDLPFPTADKIRTQDDDYWNEYRTTPKAFIPLERGRGLWGSRFGQTTSLRIESGELEMEGVRKRLTERLHAERILPGFSVVPVRQNALAASAGSTPFDWLFLALSMFVIASALMLVSLQFRLALQRRGVELGTLLSLGWNRSRVTKLLLAEMLMVSAAGVLIGILLGIGYAMLMIVGLKTWWLGAIGAPILRLKLVPQTLLIGGVCGLLICYLTIVITVARSTRVPARQLLYRGMDQPSSRPVEKNRWIWRVVVGLFVAAAGLAVAASNLGGESQAGAFMAAGFLVLLAIQLVAFLRLRSRLAFHLPFSLLNLSLLSLHRNPLRSTLIIGLVSVASFLIAAVSSFRLTPSEFGTGGFEWIANSDQPIFEPLTNESDGLMESFSFRLKTGEDASCNNLYQTSQPQVIGVPQSFIESYDASLKRFRWASTSSEFPKHRNPWQLLNHKFENGVVPVVIDKNTANYSLKIFSAGADYTVEFDTGETVRFRIVGMLENSILQGGLIVSEDNFLKLFKKAAGYRMFMLRSKSGTGHQPQVEQSIAKLRERYSDLGLIIEPARERLAKFQQVQNTYISTFQTLGALGLLLGTMGLAAVQIRSLLERQKELGLMRSVGFSWRQISRLVLMENLLLLVFGLGGGLLAALVTTLPHYIIGGASIPWIDLAVLFGVILIFGLAAAILGTRMVYRIPIVESLRTE